jgi:hypothetical protein
VLFSTEHHAMKAYWSASRSGRFTPREGPPGTQWIGGWVGQPQSRSGHGGKEKIFRPLPGLEPSIIQPIDQCYTADLCQQHSSCMEWISASLRNAKFQTTHFGKSDWLTLWSRVFEIIEKLIVTQLVKKFPTFYGTRRLTNSCIQSTPSHSISLNIPSPPRSSERFFPSGFQKTYTSRWSNSLVTLFITSDMYLGSGATIR